MRNCEELIKAIQDAKCVNVKKNEYYCFKIYSFGERGTFIEKNLIHEITDNLAESVRECFNNFDYIVSPEPGGHTWGMLVSYKLNIPVNILRLATEQFGESDISIRRDTAYNYNYLCFDSFCKGDKVIIIDDIISSGSTIRAIIRQLLSMELEVAGVQVILVKGNHYKEIERQFNISVQFLAHVEN